MFKEGSKVGEFYLENTILGFRSNNSEEIKNIVYFIVTSNSQVIYIGLTEVTIAERIEHIVKPRLGNDTYIKLKPLLEDYLNKKQTIYLYASHYDVNSTELKSYREMFKNKYSPSYNELYGY